MSNNSVLTTHVIFRNGTSSTTAESGFALAPESADSFRVYTSFATHPGSAVKLNSPIIHFFEYHLDRLLENATYVSLLNPALKEHQRAWIKQTTCRVLADFYSSCAAAPFTNLRVRLVISKDTFEVYFIAEDIKWQASTPWALYSVQATRTLPKVKTTQINASATAAREAKSHGFQEALLIDEKGFVREGSWSNVFWFTADGILHTVKSGVLPGVTRRALLESTKIDLTEIQFADFLQTASEVFISKSSTGLTPVSRIDETIFSEGRAGPLTIKLMEQFSTFAEQHQTRVFS